MAARRYRNGLVKALRFWKEHRRSFIPAAIVFWFGVAWVDLRILVVALALTGAGVWHARRRAEQARLAALDDDELLF